MNVYIHVLAVRQYSIRYRAFLAGAGCRVRGAPLDVSRRIFALTDVDAARKRSSVADDPVVADLQVMPPAVDEDSAATLGTVGDAQAVNARRVACVVARERVWNSRALGAVWRCFGNVLQKRRPDREPGERSEEHTSELQSRRDLVC